MDIKSIAWLAGLLEGEGYFGFSSTPSIQLTLCDYDTVVKAKQIYGTDLQIRKNNVKNKNHKDQYNLNICGNLAIQWMLTIYSLMSTRRKSQIQEVVNLWKLQPNRTNNEYCKIGHKLTPNNVYYNYTSNGVVKVCRYCSLAKSRRNYQARKAS